MRKTLGQELIENYEKNHSEKGPELREITMEFAKQDFFPRLQKIAKEESKNYDKKFYIQIFAWRSPHDHLWGNVKYIIRQTRPNPEPNCLLYSYDKHKDEWKYEWMLPAESSFLGILNNPESYHPHMIENVSKYMKKELV